MSKKHDAFGQVRLTPENLQKLKQAASKHPLRPKLAALVNMIIRQWDDTQTHAKP